MFQKIWQLVKLGKEKYIFGLLLVYLLVLGILKLEMGNYYILQLPILVCFGLMYIGLYPKLFSDVIGKDYKTQFKLFMERLNGLFFTFLGMLIAPVLMLSFWLKDNGIWVSSLMTLVVFYLSRLVYFQLDHSQDRTQLSTKDILFILLLDLLIIYLIKII